MQLHELSPNNKLRKKKRIGRGGKRGTYAGRGMKGQKSRAGARFEPIVRSLIKRYPKLKGYRQKQKNKNGKIKNVILNLQILEDNFNPEEKINKEILIKKGLLRKMKGRTVRVKILGKGELTKSLIVGDCEFSKTALEKIKKAEGKAEPLSSN